MDSKRRDGDGETLAAPRRVAAVAAIGMAALGMAGRVEAGNGEAIRLRDAAQSEYVLFHYTEAEAGFSAALRAAERARDRTETLASLRGLADVQFVLGRDAEAERAYLRVLDLESRRGPAEDPRRNAVLWALYAVCAARGEHAAAGEFFGRIVEESPRPVAGTAVLVDGSDIGRVTMLSRFPFKYAEAIARRDLRLHEQVYGSASEASIGRLRQVLQELGRAAEGSALSSRVRTAGALGQ